MELLIDIGRLVISYRSGTEGTGLRWNGRVRCWWLFLGDRDDDGILPRDAAFFDRSTVRRPDDWGGEDAEQSYAVGGFVLHWHRWRVPCPVKEDARLREREARRRQGRTLAQTAG